MVGVGAGTSGLLMSLQLLRAGHTDFRIYEKAGKVGGTWRENTYPNVACEVPGRGHEIQRYFEACARRYGLAPQLADGRSDAAEVLVSAIGGLHPEDGVAGRLP